MQNFLFIFNGWTQFNKDVTFNKNKTNEYVVKPYGPVKGSRVQVSTELINYSTFRNKIPEEEKNIVVKIYDAPDLMTAL